MKKEDLRIIFLGTPEFAVATLSALIKKKYKVVGVITAPDRLGGRGRKKIIESAVKQYAKSKNLTILQPKNLKNEEFLDELKALRANLQIVVAFRMLPVSVWEMPEYGTYNLHGSLLPKYRGAAPINWAIMNGEEYTGVTTFKLKHEIDTGSIAFQEKVLIEKDDYLDDVHDKMKELGAQLIIKTIECLSDGTLELREQDASKVSKAPKIYHEDCELNFENNPYNLYNKVRGLSPYPAAWTNFNNRKLKVYRTLYSFHSHHQKSGIWLSNGKDFLAVTCRDGLLFFEEVQVEGKKRLSVDTFLNGLNIKENKIPSLQQIQSPWI